MSNYHIYFYIRFICNTHRLNNFFQLLFAIINNVILRTKTYMIIIWN